MTWPTFGSASSTTRNASRKARPVTASAASIRLPAKWAWIHSRKKALGTPTCKASSSTPSRTPSPNQSPNRASPIRSATAARNVDSTVPGS